MALTVLLVVVFSWGEKGKPLERRRKMMNEKKQREADIKKSNFPDPENWHTNTKTTIADRES